jgi:hypothetical protein
VLQGILTLATAYNLVQGPSTNIGPYLQNISNSLNQISGTLVRIQSQLDTIIWELRRLEQTILSGINDQEIKVRLAEAQYAAFELAQYDNETKLKQNIDRVGTALYELGRSINVIGALRGLDSMMVTAPLLSTWMNAKMMYERGRKQLDSSYVINSPWSHAFFKNVKVIYESTFEKIKLLDSEYQRSVIPSLVWSGYIIEESNGRFFHRYRDGSLSSKPPPVGEQPLFPSTGDLALSCPVTRNNRVIQTSHLLKFTREPPVFGTWKQVITPSNDRERRALAATATFVAQQAGVAAFYEVMPAIYKEKQTVLNAFVAPSGWDF